MLLHNVFNLYFIMLDVNFYYLIINLIHSKKMMDIIIVNHVLYIDLTFYKFYVIYEHFLYQLFINFLLYYHIIFIKMVYLNISLYHHLNSFLNHYHPYIYKIYFKYNLNVFYL